MVVFVTIPIKYEEVRNGKLADIRCPHDHQHLLGRYHQADPEFAIKAVIAAEKAKKEWDVMPCYQGNVPAAEEFPLSVYGGRVAAATLASSCPPDERRACFRLLPRLALRDAEANKKAGGYLRLHFFAIEVCLVS